LRNTWSQTRKQNCKLTKEIGKEMNESVYGAIKAREKQDEEAKLGGRKVENKKMPAKWKKKQAPSINFAEIPIW